MSDRATKAAEAAPRGDGRATQGTSADADAARAAKARRGAWLLAGLAVLVYLGYIAWMFTRANGG